jgi:ankyrin repeat protein
MRKRLIPGNIKNDYENEVAEWVDDDDVSSYHSVTIPYGPKYHARKIEKLLFTKDLLLNSEWNKPKDREVNLHRHPAFFGSVDDVIHDCCGYCPKPITIEEEEVAEEESKTFISGGISFIQDDPGRQAIGSFNPLSAEDWTTMAYVGNTALLCQAIVDGDLNHVQSWLEQEGNDPNTRDFTGRTPLHLAVSNSSLEVVQALIDHGARLVARLVDGKTALHLAAIRGRVDIVSALLRKSEANEEEEEKKFDARRAARKAAKGDSSGIITMQDADKSHPNSAEGESDIEMVDASDAKDENMDRTTESSIVDIRHPPVNADDQVLAKDEKEDEPDVYDINVTAWDTAVSPLHLAIAKGHMDVVKCLVQDFGADPLLPIKLFNDHDKSARAAILTLVLALPLPTTKANEMARTLIQLGASSAQASIDQTTVLQYCIADTPDLLDTLGDADMAGVMRAINHLSVSGYWYNIQVASPLMTAIQAKDSATAVRLLGLGAKPEIDFAAYMKAYQTKYDPPRDSKSNKCNFEQ